MIGVHVQPGHQSISIAYNNGAKLPMSCFGELNLEMGLDTHLTLITFGGHVYSVIFEPCCEKTVLRGFLPGPMQTGLYNHIRWLEA